MNLWLRIRQLFISRQPYKLGPPTAPLLVLTEGCIAGLQECLQPEIDRSHEGICYLVGQSNGATTLAIAAIRPKAKTTRGSFHVESTAMAQVVRTALNQGLQLVGQLHTHPGMAFHSEGDEAGARIAYTGYVSIVLPDYGRHLPSVDGAAAYMFQIGEGFIPLDPSAIAIVPGRVS